MHQIAFAQWTHDIRNALSTIALYVDTLERPDNPHSIRTVASTQALLAKVAGMCSGAAKQSRDGAPSVARGRFDLTRSIAQVRELIATILPPAVSLHVEAPGPTQVVADMQDVFRILFNLLHNAATVARRTDSLRTIRMTLERDGAMAVISVSDDGPGVPEPVRKRLFLGGGSTTGGSGQGLAIARELAERNGGTLRLADAAQGATFVLEVPLDPSAIDRVATLYAARERHFAPGAAGRRDRSEHVAR
jgi:signal transduction histidine kinase